MLSKLFHTRFSKIDIFVYLHYIHNLRAHIISVNDDTFDKELKDYSNFCDPCVRAPEKQNISGTHM